jgi:hypothetical protein
VSQQSSNAASSRKRGGAAARSKVRKLEFEGLTLKLPAKMPFRVLRHFSDDMGISQIIAVLRDVLGDEQMESVWELDIDIDRGTQLMDEIFGVYGMGTGESPASAGS